MKQHETVRNIKKFNATDFDEQYLELLIFLKIREVQYV